MIPPVKIGKHTIQIESVVNIFHRRDWLFRNRYDVTTTTGKITLTPSEKAKLDKEIKIHQTTMGIYKQMQKSQELITARAQQRRVQ